MFLDQKEKFISWRNDKYGVPLFMGYERFQDGIRKIVSVLSSL